MAINDYNPIADVAQWGSTVVAAVAVAVGIIQSRKKTLKAIEERDRQREAEAEERDDAKSAVLFDESMLLGKRYRIMFKDVHDQMEKYKRQHEEECQPYIDKLERTLAKWESGELSLETE